MPNSPRVTIFPRCVDRVSRAELAGKLQLLFVEIDGDDRISLELPGGDHALSLRAENRHVKPFG